MKTYLSNLRMTKKLLVSPVVAIIFLFIFGLVSCMGFFRQKATLDDIYQNRFRNYQSSADIIMNLRKVHADVYKIISWSSAGYEKSKVDALTAEQSQTMKKAQDTIQQISKSPKLTKVEQGLFQSAGALLIQYQDTVNQITSMDVTTASMLMSQADDHFQQLNKTLAELLALEEKLSKDQYISSYATFRSVLVLAGIVFLIAVILPFMTSLLMKSVILAPIGETVKVIEEVAEGNLTKRINVNSSDEIGEMAKHFNEFVVKLHQTINQVARSSREVSSAAAMLDDATERMATGVEQAAIQVNSVATASEEMSMTCSEIARNCITAVKSSEEANGSAGAGEETIVQTITVMNRIAERVKESARIIKSLGVRSDQIGEIVGLINDVADQTNLLALNAAIEAARAGEQGRGFAVVADEVRKLAEKTSTATKEISDTVNAMQAETRRVVLSMEEGVTEVGIGTDAVDKSGQALKDISSHINKVTGQINQIAVASGEETATTNEIANSIQQISEVMHETSRSIQENAQASSQLANHARELQEMVGQFRLEE